MTGLISVERWPIFQLDAVYRAFDVSNFVGSLRSTSTCWPELPWNDQTLPSGSASGKALLSIRSFKLCTSFVKLWLACLTARISEMSMSHQRAAPRRHRFSPCVCRLRPEQPADDLRRFEHRQDLSAAPTSVHNFNLHSEIGGASPPFYLPLASPTERSALCTGRRAGRRQLGRSLGVPPPSRAMPAYAQVRLKCTSGLVTYTVEADGTLLLSLDDIAHVEQAPCATHEHLARVVGALEKRISAELSQTACESWIV